jgi:hypothetical protein
MPDPDDIMPEQVEFPEPEELQLPQENAAPSPTEQVSALFDTMGDMAQVAAMEVSPVQPQVVVKPQPFAPQQAAQNAGPEAALTASSGARKSAPLAERNTNRIERAKRRGAERKARIAAKKAGRGPTARLPGRGATGQPPFAQVEPPLGADFHPEAFADQGFDMQEMEHEGQQRDVQRETFDAGARLNILLTEMTKEYGRRLDDLANRLERDRL